MSKILIVDDEPDLVDLLELVLKSLGYEVLIATDGKTAVDMARYDKPSIIFLDLRFPKGQWDGVVILEKIREFDKGVKVVISSGLDARDNRYEQAEQFGVSKRLYKPATIAAIRQLMKELA